MQPAAEANGKSRKPPVYRFEPYFPEAMQTLNHKSVKGRLSDR